jgi:hypothetical protein
MFIDFLTGAPDPLRLVTSPTVIFTNYSFGLPAAVTANAKLSSLEVKDEEAILIVTSAGGKFKVQAKDSAQGGVLQTEPELSSGAVEMTRILGPSIFYFINEFTGKVCSSIWHRDGHLILANADQLWEWY